MDDEPDVRTYLAAALEDHGYTVTALESGRALLRTEGADIMHSVIGPEPKILAQLIANMAIIFRAAGADRTMPSLDGWDNSNMAMYSGDFEVMGRVERLHWDRALELKVKRMVMGECGHAFRGAAYDGPRWLGWSTKGMAYLFAGLLVLVFLAFWRFLTEHEKKK